MGSVGGSGGVEPPIPWLSPPGGGPRAWCGVPWTSFGPLLAQSWATTLPYPLPILCAGRAKKTATAMFRQRLAGTLQKPTRRVTT